MGVKNEGSPEEIALKGIEAMEKFYHSVGMPINLRELGINPSEEEIVQMAKGAAQATGGSRGAAKVCREADFAEIFRQANRD